MGKLLQLITKLFGKNALSKTLGTRTNVIKLPSNEKKRLIKDELNIEAASELAAQKVFKEAEDLIADIPRMNDQEVLTFTGNLQRLDNKLNPPSAEVVDITTKQPVTGEGLEQLAARDGLPADVSPDSPIGRVMQGAQRLRKEKDELDKMLKDPAKQLEQEMQNPYRSGGALDPQMGIVRTAARQVLQKLAREGKINIADPEEAKAIIEGYQGGVDPIEVFRKTFGQDALGDLANLGDELLEIDNRGGSFKELKKILEDEGFFNLQQPKNPTQGMTDEELMKLIRDEDPEEFATGGRVGFNDGGYTFEQFLKDKQQVDKFMSIEELKREYKRMMELKKIRDQRDMVATGGRVGFQTGGPTDEGILSLEEAQKLNPGMFVDTTTYNPIPEDAANKAADEIAKMIMGTLGMDDDMTSRTFIFESYVMPKRKELMEDFGLTMKEADDLIQEGMAKYRTNKATGGRVGFQKGSPEIFDQLEMGVPYPYGHRVNYAYGSGLKLIQILQKAGKSLKDEIKKAVDDLIPSGDPKIDADMAVDNMLEDLNIDRDTLDQYDVLDAYGMAYDELKKPLLAELKNKPKSFPKTADEFAVNFDDDIDISQGMIDLDEMNFTKNAQAAKKAIDNASIDTDLLKAKLMEPGSKPIKQGDPITSENFGESQFAPDTSDLEKAKKLAPKMVERFELKMKYPGIDEDFLTKIIDDPDPQRKAEVLAVLDQSMLLVREGKSGDEIVDILKKETKGRKPNARGGLNYLMGM